MSRTQEDFIMRMYSKRDPSILLNVVKNIRGSYTEEEVNLAKMFLDKLQEDGCEPLQDLLRHAS